MQRRQRNPKGKAVKWFREDLTFPGPLVFYSNIPKVAKAFGEHLSSAQSTEVALRAAQCLAQPEKNLAQAAGVLLRSFLEECGKDMDGLPTIVREIYTNLSKIEDPTAAEIWRALAADPYSSIKLMKPLLKRLQDKDVDPRSSSTRHSKSQMPMAATSALCAVLSASEAAAVLQNYFPHLLVALLVQIYAGQVLEPILGPLVSCALDPERAIAKEALRTLPCVFRHMEVEEFGFVGTDLIPHLPRYFSDDEEDVRQASVSLFGMLLSGVKEPRRNAVTEDVLGSLVPLLIQLADPGSREAARGALSDCASFMRWTDIPSDLFDCPSSGKLYNAYLDICKHTVSRTAAAEALTPCHKRLPLDVAGLARPAEDLGSLLLRGGTRRGARAPVAASSQPRSCQIRMAIAEHCQPRSLAPLPAVPSRPTKCTALT
ncbi:uncharacterized protein LOC123020218, partial [Varanus komodoensis]|uniref:uncharacterized protein LOC123020218 n=1 Tax=Varanus komodoensis TaxID=61221 RepID=UPI001CF7A790